MATYLVLHIIIIIDSPLKWGDKDNVGLIADTLVHGVEVSESICHGCLIGAIQLFYRKPMCPW